MSTERRRAPRYQFVAEAEVVEIKSGTKSNAKTGDLSLGGCFLDTLNPSPEGAEVLVTISQADRRCSALGQVVFSLPRLGMGIAFTHVGSDQLSILEGWLDELERCRHASLAVSTNLNQDDNA